jgi:hemerythrin-like domain-containing protein
MGAISRISSQRNYLENLAAMCHHTGEEICYLTRTLRYIVARQHRPVTKMLIGVR